MKAQRYNTLFSFGLLLALVQLSSATSPNTNQEQAHLELGSLEGYSQVAILLGRQASQAADVMVQFLMNVNIADENYPFYPPCFIKERTPVAQTTNVDFHRRLIEDHQSAVGYSRYISIVREHFREVIENAEQTGQSCSYCLYLDNLESSVNIMTRSLENLVRFINGTTPTAMPTQGGNDQLPEEEEEEKEEPQEGEGTACSSPCYEQQLLVYTRLIGFAAEYISTDATGILPNTN